MRFYISFPSALEQLLKFFESNHFLYRPYEADVIDGQDSVEEQTLSRKGEDAEPQKMGGYRSFVGWGQEFPLKTVLLF